DLGFLVETEDNGQLWWVEVEPDHVDELLFEGRVVAQLEGVDLPGFEVVVLPDAGHGVFADPKALGHQARRPMRRAVIGNLVEGVMNHGGHRAIGEPGLAATTRRDSTNAVDAVGLESPAPCTDRFIGGVATSSYLVCAHPIGCQQERLGLDHLAMSER